MATTLPSSPTLTRRAVVRQLAGGTLALAGVSALVAAKPALAGIAWCRTDPLITVNGKTGHVYVDSTAEMLTSATGPIQLEVRVPAGAIASAIPLDKGFGYGYTITFVEDARLASRGSVVDVRVRAYAPSSNGSLPVRVIFHADDPSLADSIKTSTANTWIETGTVKL